MSGEIDIKKNYKDLLERYKSGQDSNEFLKGQLQELSTKLKQEQRDKEKLREEVIRARSEIVGRHSPIPIAISAISNLTDGGPAGSPAPYPSSPAGSPSAFAFDREAIIDGLQRKLKEAYNRLDDEMISHEETKHSLEYYKQMLAVEGKTRLFIEERNSVLEAEVKDLRGQAASDMLIMSTKLEEANKRLEDEISARTILEKSKQSLENEIEELTKSLFEEANSMVSTEARQRHELAVAKKQLEQELEDTKSKLAMDQLVLRSLQERFDQLEKEKKASRFHHRSSHSTSSVAMAAAALRGVNSQPNLVAMDGCKLVSSPMQVITPTGSPREETLIRKSQRSRSLGEVDPVTVEALVDAGRKMDQIEEVASPPLPAATEEGMGADWEVLGAHGDDDSALNVLVESQINVKGGLSQFIAFVQSAKQEWTGSRIMDRVLREDVGPCLRLRGAEDKAYRKLLEAVWNNKIFLEPTSSQSIPCTGCDAEGPCKWRLRYSTDMEWKIIDDSCRERIIRACDFYSYLRNIRKGLVKKSLVAMYKEFLHLRLMMCLARVCAG